MQEWRIGLGGSALSLAALRMDSASFGRAGAALSARLPLQELAFSWQLDDGTLRHLLANGEPRSDDSGHFAGYWGLARDISAAARAQSEMVATEQRYQLLFNRMPSPLVLHRDGHIVDANLAAARLLGYARVEDMRGRDALKLHMDESARAASRQRLTTLGDDAAGQNLPLIERELSRCDGSRVHTLSTEVRLDHGGAPATLVLMIDETDRRAAALATERSQGLLTWVVANSPDIITLSPASACACCSRLVMLARIRCIGWSQRLRGNRMHPRRGGQGPLAPRGAQPGLTSGQAMQRRVGPLATPALRVSPQNSPTRRCKCSLGPKPNSASRLDWDCFGGLRGCIRLPLSLSAPVPAPATEGRPAALGWVTLCRSCAYLPERPDRVASAASP